MVSEAEVIADPTRYGLPTLAEYIKNPQYWREKLLGKPDELFGIVDRGSESLSHHVKQHIYEIDGYRCKTLEEVDRVASEQGIPLNGLKCEAQVIPLGGGSCDILVKFVSSGKREPKG